MGHKKLWDKGVQIDKKIEKFTIGLDNVLDIEIAEYDVLGSMAHVTMLSEQGLLDKNLLPELKAKLKAILKDIRKGNFSIDEGVEDVHSQVEMLLGEHGAGIHTGRSRNDQVLVDLKMFYRKALSDLIEKVGKLSLECLKQAEIYQDIMMPGYTHTQVAMTSSFGMWFAAFGESFKEDAELASQLFPIINKNPLGSAAGYGSSFPLNRTRTTELLGFDGMHTNPINAQYGRGKSELLMAQCLSVIALSINKMATDMILYSNENYRFLSLPSALTTGSSIMPHKKNPDVFELIRAYSNSLMNLPNQITMVISNLTTGYHRDFQLLKEYLFPAIHKMNDLLDIIEYTLPRIIVHKQITEDPKYDYLYTVDAVNEMVKKGIPFRKAYLQIGQDIEKGQFNKPQEILHTHEGSIGNLCIEEIRDDVQRLLDDNPYNPIAEKMKRLAEDN